MAVADWEKRFSLAGRKALVTGASKGIGFEICRVFADAGADIVAVARDADGLLEVKREVEARGRRCLVIEAEMGTPEGPVTARLVPPASSSQGRSSAGWARSA